MRLSQSTLTLKALYNLTPSSQFHFNTPSYVILLQVNQSPGVPGLLSGLSIFAVPFLAHFFPYTYLPQYLLSQSGHLLLWIPIAPILSIIPFTVGNLGML